MVDESSSLCTDCGLCCDGTLFARARVRPQVADATSALGFEVTMQGEHLAFSLPCDRLDGMCCTIYETRPEVCRTFRCKLLLQLDKGEVTLTEARATVATAKTVLAHVVAIEPRARHAQSRKELRIALAARRGAGDREDLPARARLELELHVLQKQLDRLGRPVPDVQAR